MMPENHQKPAQEEWNATSSALPDFESDCETIKAVFAIDIPRFAGFAQVKAVAKMAKMYKDGGHLEGFSKYRTDHVHNCHRFMALTLLCTDMDKNLLVAPKRLPDGNWIYQEVDNAYLADKLSMPKRTVDEAISTCRDEGYYFSKERYIYERDAGELIFKGKKSVKRACWKVFADVMSCAVEYVRAQSYHAKKGLLLVPDTVAKVAGGIQKETRSRGYAKAAKAQKRDRRLKREARQAERTQAALKRAAEETKKVIDFNSLSQAKKDRSSRINELILSGASRLNAIMTVNVEFPELPPYPIPK